MALTLGISQGVEFREKIPIKQPLNRIPTQIGEWTGATAAPLQGGGTMQVHRAFMEKSGYRQLSYF